MEKLSYLPAHILVWLDETDGDRHHERRKRGYNLQGMTPCVYHLIAQGKRMSSIAIMSTQGIEDVDVCDGNINGNIIIWKFHY